MMQVLEGGNNKLGKVYTCNVCLGKQLWTENHMHIMRPELGSKYEYCTEHYFVICSNECLQNAKDAFVKWLSKLKGWTKKKAMENVQYALAEDKEELDETIVQPVKNDIIYVTQPKPETEDNGQRC